MKEDLELQQHELENERLEVKEQYQNAMKEQNIAQQTQLSKLKEEITEKEKLFIMSPSHLENILISMSRYTDLLTRLRISTFAIESLFFLPC